MNWTRELWRMESVHKMAEFVELWDLVSVVQLVNQDDTIRWKWTNDGTYTAKSVYLAQFKGSVSPFKSDAIWRDINFLLGC